MTRSGVVARAEAGDVEVGEAIPMPSRTWNVLPLTSRTCCRIVSISRCTYVCTHTYTLEQINITAICRFIKVLIGLKLFTIMVWYYVLLYIVYGVLLCTIVVDQPIPTFTLFALLDLLQGVNLTGEGDAQNQ